MELKPKFDTNTIKFSAPIQKSSLEQKVIADPKGVISNGIYKVIKWEKIRQLYIILFSAIATMAMLILISLYATIYPTPWIGFVLPIITLLISGYKLLMTLMELSSFKRAILRYREDLKIGISHNPPFIVRMYRSLHMKQVTHNWATFFLLFNGGLMTLILWGLKNLHWWIFRFDKWIRVIFHNPDVMQWIFTIALIAIAVVHIIFAIQRRKRILDIDSYFGNNIISITDLETEKQSKNKMYRRLFIVYVMIMLIIPILTKWIIQFLRRKK